MNNTTKVKNRVGEWLVHNGVFESNGSAPSMFQNRAFTLGDGFFETIRILDGKILHWSAHYQRLVAAAAGLHFELGQQFDSENLLATAQKLLANEGIQRGGRLRITIFREGTGAYLPNDDRAGYAMEAFAIHQNEFQPHPQGLILSDFTDLRKDYSRISAYKLHGNHVYIQAARMAAKSGVDDLLIHNSQGLAIEAISSNIFTVHQGALYTPSISDGCVAGVMRMAVINAALEAGISVFEQQMKRTTIERADEFFLTNVISGCSWVKGYGAKRYTHRTSDRMIELLNHRIFSEALNSI